MPQANATSAAPSEVTQRASPREAGRTVAPAAKPANIAAGPRTPKDQLQSILLTTERPERKQALEDLAAALARHDPAAAATLVKSIMAERGADSGEAYDFVSAFASEYAGLNPAATAEWAEFLPLTLKFAACGFVAQQWTKTDVVAATRWAEGIPDLALKAAVLRRMSQELDEAGDPKVAGAWAERVAQTAASAPLAESIGRLWAKSDPAAAFRWAAALEDSVTRGSAVVAIAGIVAEQNPETARTWIEQFPPGELRNQAASVTTAKWSESNPEAAARWVSSLGDPQLIEVTIHGIARQWMQRDRERASEWIRNAPVSRTTKEYLVGPGPGG